MPPLFQRPALIFDLETVPDCAGLRLLYSLSPTLSDEEVVELAYQKQREKNNSEFLPHYLHKIVAISVVLRWFDARNPEKSRVAVKTLGEEGESEAEQIGRFFMLIDQYQPQLVSWNGGGFDLPVLHYRALQHGISSREYWDNGKFQSHKKWENYRNRYQDLHLDLMDMFSLYQRSAAAPLDSLAKLCGFAGKMGMDGGQVWQAFCAGKLSEIRAYCETDVANTYLIYLRFLLISSYLSMEQYQTELCLFREHLNENIEKRNGRHWIEFLELWKSD